MTLPQDGTPARSNRRLTGVLLLCAGAFIFTLQDIIIKWISGEYPITEILAIRSVVAILPMLLLVHLDGGLAGLRSRRRGRLLFRAALLCLSYTTYYLSLAALPLAEAAALFFTAPLFIVALSGPLLKEHVGAGRWFAIALGFVGVIVIWRPNVEAVEPAALFSIAAALLYALAQVLARDLGGGVRASIMSFYQNGVNLSAALLVGAIAGGGGYAHSPDASAQFLLRAWTIPTTVDLLLMAATGIIAAIAIWCLTNAYRVAEATVVAPFEYTAIIWVTLAGLEVFGEVPTINLLAGIVLIVAAGLYVLRPSR